MFCIFVKMIWDFLKSWIIWHIIPILVPQKLLCLYMRTSHPTCAVLTADTPWSNYPSVYVMNPWLGQFGRGNSSLGGLSVTETEDR